MALENTSETKRYVITSEADLNTFIQQDKPVWLFKHSNACGTSTYAMSEYESYLSAHPDDTAAVIVIQEHRDLSNLTADLLHIVHKSPQLFLVQAGKVLWHTSHMGIAVKQMETAMHQAQSA